MILRHLSISVPGEKLLEDKTRRQEFIIEGLRSEVEELREKLAELDDEAVPR
jgi:hypothetical protein